jgi:hypothetical protein
MSIKRSDDSLNAEGWILDKYCLVTNDTRASMMIVRPNITRALPKGELTQPYILKMASGETLPALKEALVKLTLG